MTIGHTQESSSELIDIIAQEHIKTLFQPITSLRTGEVLGYEALSRGPQGSRLEMPLALFAQAEEEGRAWELEYLCRRLAISRYSATDCGKLLFLNVNPRIIEDPRFTQGCTMEQIIDGGMCAANIVFEITERTSVTNYLEFCRILQHYTDQGFRIAIDDTGAGYSGLNMMASVRPQYIKVDMSLVRDVDKDPFKRNLMRFLVDFSTSTGLTLIAEGIETEDEVKALVELNVEFGQGYFLGRPNVVPEPVSPDVCRRLESLSEAKVAMGLKTIMTVNVGEFARAVQWLRSDTPCATVEGILDANEDIMGIPIVDDSKVVGLVMRDKFYMKLGSKYGYSLFHSRAISMLMDPEPLTVDHQMPIEQVSRAAMGRRSQRLYDYIIVTMDDRYYGVITVKDLLERTTELEIRYARYSQPLTGLPGNVIIESEISKALGRQRFSVLYVDLDSFKAYNDVYGFERGDDVIRYTAELILEHFSGLGAGTFVGHIGGDDFVVVTANWDISEQAHEFVRAFDAGIIRFYNETDLRRGYIVSVNRKGEKERFPIVSVSVAVIQNRIETFVSYHQVATRAAELKRLCKSVQGSVISYDRRTYDSTAVDESGSA